LRQAHVWAKAVQTAVNRASPQLPPTSSSRSRCSYHGAAQPVRSPCSRRKRRSHNSSLSSSRARRKAVLWRSVRKIDRFSWVVVKWSVQFD
jgi:hypothetical protein